MIITFLQDVTLHQWLTAAGFVVGGFIIGVLFDSIILNRLKHLAAKSSWEGDDIIIHAVHGVARFWFTLGGLYLGILALSVPPDVLKPARMVLVVIVLFSATVVGARIAAGLAGLYGRQTVGADKSASIFMYFAKLLVYILGLLVILQSVGISITPILTALGVGGLAVALALQDTLSNLFAGLSIISVRKVKIGDFVRLDSGEDGYVTDITWRYTEIRALANNMILIPNSKFAGAIVTNFYRPDRDLSVSLDLGVAYNSDLEKVEKVVIEVAREVMTEVKGGVTEGFDPFIRYNNFGESSIRFTAILRGLEYTDQYLIRHEFIKRLKQRFDREGIEIPFPIRTVYLHNDRSPGDSTAEPDPRRT